MYGDGMQDRSTYEANLRLLRTRAKQQPLDILGQQFELLAITDPLAEQSRERIYAECGAALAPQHLSELAPKEFAALLRGPIATRWPQVANLATRSHLQLQHLRDALAEALDESVDLAERLQRLWSRKARAPYSALNHGLLTPMLHILRPSVYPVWSIPVEQSLRMLALWPRPAAIGGDTGQYLALIVAMRRMSEELDWDFWTLESALDRFAEFAVLDRFGVAANW